MSGASIAGRADWLQRRRSAAPAGGAVATAARRRGSPAARCATRCSASRWPTSTSRRRRCPRRRSRRAEAAGFKTVPTGIEHGTITVVAGGRPLRGDDAARRHRDRRAPRQGALRPRLEGATPSGATSPSTRSTPTADGDGGRPGRRARRPRKPHAALHRRCRDAHPRGLSAHPALLPLLRLVWLRPAGCRGAEGLRAAEGRARPAVGRAGLGGAEEAACRRPIRRARCCGCGRPAC